MRLSRLPVFFFFLLALAACRGNHDTHLQDQRPPRENQQQVPPNVYQVLKYVTRHGRAPEGYQGGRRFGNFERLLPEKEAGRKIHYREWDVNPKKKNKNRGSERLVTGDNGSAYYTSDHYHSFTEISPP